MDLPNPYSLIGFLIIFGTYDRTVLPYLLLLLSHPPGSANPYDHPTIP